MTKFILVCNTSRNGIFFFWLQFIVQLTFRQFRSCTADFLAVISYHLMCDTVIPCYSYSTLLDNTIHCSCYCALILIPVLDYSVGLTVQCRHHLHFCMCLRNQNTKQCCCSQVALQSDLGETAAYR